MLLKKVFKHTKTFNSVSNAQVLSFLQTKIFLREFTERVEVALSLSFAKMLSGLTQNNFPKFCVLGQDVSHFKLHCSEMSLTLSFTGSYQISKENCIIFDSISYEMHS